MMGGETREGQRGEGGAAESNVKVGVETKEGKGELGGIAESSHCRRRH